MNLADALANHARNRPTHPAVIDGGRVVTYRELDSLVGGAVARLRAEGLRAGDFVGLLLDDKPDYLITLYAVLRLGAVAVPMNRRWSAREQATAAHALSLAAVAADGDLPHIDGTRVIALGAERSAGVEGSPPAAGDGRAADRPAMLFLSSGTTDTPKSVLFTHAQLWQRFLKYCVNYGVCAQDRCLTLLPFNFGIPRHAAMTLLQLGGTVVLGQTIGSPTQLVDAAMRHEATWLGLVPALIRQLLALSPSARPLLPTLRVLEVTSSRLLPQERADTRARLTPHFFETYSATEGGIFAVATPRDQDARPGSVGRAAPGMEIEIVDAKDRRLPPGQTGLIRTRGPGLALAYHRNPAATAQAFRGGWFYPGDLGQLDAEGYLTLAGRADDVINFDGIKIQPDDVEATLAAHPAVAEAAVVGWEATPLREVPIAFVVTKAAVSEDDLLAFCRQRLADYAVPRRILAIARLPRTGSGKVMRAQLRASLCKKESEPG